MKTVRRIFLSFLCLLSCFGVGPACQIHSNINNVRPPQIDPALARTAQEGNIKEAVLRYQMEMSKSWAYPVKPKFFFLSFGKDGDPPDEFMQRFQGHQPPVKKESEVEMGLWGVKEGLIISATQITWHSNQRVDVKGGYYGGELYAAGILYSVERQGDRWVVVSHQVTIVS